MTPAQRPGAAGPADGRLWPNAEQQLLLDAALQTDDARAVAAWQGWRARVDVERDDFSWAAQRLLPLVYRRLVAMGAQDPLLGRMKGVYRRVWFETHRLLERARPAVAALRAAGVDVLLTKGAPLGAAYYESAALRPMSDLDVCVHPADARRAVDVLRAHGWRTGRPVTDDHLRFFHAVQCFGADGGEVDLHWHVMVESVGNALDDALWADTEPFDFGGLRVRQLAPTSLLLHTVVHGVRWNLEPPVRWIPDAVLVLRRRGADVDWPRVVALARRARVTHRVALGLDYLVRHFDAPVPAPALAALARARITLPERWERSVILRDTVAVRGTAAGNQWSILADLARQIHPLRQPLTYAAALPHYLRYRFDLGGRRELLPMLARGLARRLPGARRAVDGRVLPTAP